MTKNNDKVLAELSEILPEVEKAKALVRNLEASKLQELRTYFRMNVPKMEVYMVLKSMLQLIGYQDPDWSFITKNFGSEQINSLISFDVSKLTRENFRKVKKIVDDNSSFFIKSNIQR